MLRVTTRTCKLWYVKLMFVYSGYTYWLKLDINNTWFINIWVYRNRLVKRSMANRINFILFQRNIICITYLRLCQCIFAIGYKLFMKCQVTHQLLFSTFINIYSIQSITCYKRVVAPRRSIRPWKCFWNESVALHDRTNGNKYSMLFWDNG